MSSSDLAVSARHLSKSYTIRHNVTDHITLAELALDRIKHPLHRAEREQFQALRDVSFDLHVGEVLGLIGRNGAGKSTLLKVLGRITDPTAGEVRVWGRVGSLLEVGTGFHPELTGRENVYLNGSILGMSRKEVGRKFDAIVEFAGVERFLDTPVKRFSSGMYVRLAFAVAAHLDAEVLLLDEVLAVGDADFQARCLGKVSDLAQSGRAVILVSHNMSTMQEFTSRAMLLDSGRLALLGPVESVVARYLESGASVADDVDVSQTPRYDGNLGTRARILRVRLNHANGLVSSDEDLGYSVTVRSTEDLGPVFVSQIVFTRGGRAVGRSVGAPCIYLKRDCQTRFDVRVPRPSLAPGAYYLGVGLALGTSVAVIDNLDVVTETVHFEMGVPMSDGQRVERWEPSWGNVRLAEPRVDCIDTSPVP